MSEFLAEASVLIKPDTTRFRAELAAQIRKIAAEVPAISVPIALAGGGLAGAAAATGSLAAAQKIAVDSTLGLASAAQVETSAFGRQAVVLGATTAETQALAGAQSVLAATQKQTTASLLGAGTATARLNAGLLGLRTAVGSSAVIGLGATALAAIFLGKALRAAITDAAAFERELNVFRETSGATASEMEQVSSAAKQLGADITLPAVSASDAAEAMTGLAKAGLSVQDSLAGARGVLQLATAANISNADAVNIAANALNAFGLGGDQAIRVADDLANAANAAQGSISDFGLALQQSAAVARQVGLNLEDTAAILTILARNGLAGSDAGTSLRVALIRLVAPTKQASGLIKALGLNIRDAQGNLRPDVFAQFAAATANLSNELRDATAAAIFGQDAIRAVAIAGREGAEGLKLAQLQIDQQGTAARIAAARTEGLAGAFSALSSDAQTLGITFGTFASGPLTEVTKGLADLLSQINAFASGDFGDLGDDASKGFETAARRARGFFDVVKGIGGTDFGSISKGIAELTKPPPSQPDAAGQLLDELNALQKLRTQEFQAKIDIGPITKQIKDLRSEIKKQGIEAGDIIPVTKLERALAPLRAGLAAARALRTELRDQGKDTEVADQAVQQFITKIQAAIRRGGDEVTKLGQDSAKAIQAQIEAAARVFLADPTGPAADKALAAVRDLLRKLKALGEKDGTDAGAGIGQKIMDALQGAIAGSAGDVQSELRKALQIPPSLQQQLAGQISGLQEQQLDIRAAGGSDQQQLGNLREQEERARKRVQALKDHVEGRRKAKADLDSIISQEQSLEDQIAADAKSAADDRKRAQDESDSAFLELLGSRREADTNAILKAQGTKTLKDDIEKNETFRSLLKRQVEQVRKTVQDAAKRAAELRDLTRQLIQVRLTLDDLNRQEREAIRQRQQERRESFSESLSLDVQIAEATGNRNKEIKAREAEIANTKRLLHMSGRSVVEQKKLVLQLREEQKALRELKGEKDKTSDLTFEFLQKQQGFAANLLGNLIPGGATAGLVGGGAGPVFTLQGPTSPAQGVQTAAAISGSRDNPLTRGDVQTELHLLRSILNELRDGNSKGDHPEAWFNRRVSGAAMDTMGV